MRISVSALSIHVTLFISIAAALGLWTEIDAAASTPELAFTPTVEAETRAVASIALSPDGGWLYAVTLIGEIERWRVDPKTGALSDLDTLSLDLFREGGRPHGLLGLAFDPADPQVLWVTDNAPVALRGPDETVPDFSGRIVRIRLGDGDALTGEAEVYVRGLPRSCSDHMTNSLAFRPNPKPGPGRPDHLLYLTQGANTAMGAADIIWCFRPERLLSAAILEIDPRRTPPEGGFDVTTEPLPDDGLNRRFGYNFSIRSYLWPSDDGDLKNGGIQIDSGQFAGRYLHFDSRGVASVREGAAADSPLIKTFYDPFAEDAPVRLFATGLRNAFDLVWHPNGWLYATGNGSAAGGSAPDDPRTTADEGLSKMDREEDWLFRLRGGDYAGQPNPVRDEFIKNGGNPTAGPDVNEVADYAVGVAPDPRYIGERAYSLGHHRSANGLTIYHGGSYSAALDGALVFVEYSLGDDVRVIVTGEDGEPVQDFMLTDPFGKPITQIDPLDVALGAEGRLYVSTMERSNGSGVILLLDPSSVD